MVPRDAGSTGFAEGLPYLERAVSIHEASGANVFLSRMYWMWADGLLLAGDTEEAIEKTRHALALSGAFGERGVEAEASLLLADIEATSDQLVAAASHYSHAIAIGEELAMRPTATRPLPRWFREASSPYRSPRQGLGAIRHRNQNVPRDGHGVLAGAGGGGDARARMTLHSPVARLARLCGCSG